MNLITYIEQIGDAKAAHEFGTTERAAASWRRRERFPSLKKAREISALKGWTLEQVYPKQAEECHQ
jgi:hypothetical protein